MLAEKSLWVARLQYLHVWERLAIDIIALAR